MRCRATPQAGHGNLLEWLDSRPADAQPRAGCAGGQRAEFACWGGKFINAVTPPKGTVPETLPVWLRLVRNGSTYTGYYSLDNQNWKLVGSATLSAQADTQDAGIFVTSHTSGSPRQVTFNGFNVAAGANPPALTNRPRTPVSNTIELCAGSWSLSLTRSCKIVPSAGARHTSWHGPVRA
jgi:hypothetical protein